MNSRATSCFPSNPSSDIYVGVNEDLVTIDHHHQASSSTSNSPSNSLLYSLCVLKEKVHQVQSLVNMFISPNKSQPSESNAIAVATMGTLIQEIIVTASSMMYSCQNFAMGSNGTVQNNTDPPLHISRDKPQEETRHSQDQGQGFYAGEVNDWYHNSYDNFYMKDYNKETSASVSQHKTLSGPLSNNTYTVVGSSEQVRATDLPARAKNNKGPPKNYDIIELDAEDLLAKYTHYCHVCGKGFKRDANLRMHMRAHGDEYKSSAALSNPMKNIKDRNGNNSDDNMTFAKKYSCPQEGCRWNKKHAKFQPLKSMICVKNHYRRSHCPKMYVCKRCNQKQFSVLSDLRTHEKHCGDLKWQCSCGTTFSRKDKLMGHVALFVGHSPMTSSSTTGKVEQIDQRMQM